MEYLHFVVAALFGSGLAWRCLRETSLLSILALGPLLGSAALVALANARVPPALSLGLLLTLAIVLVALPGRERPSGPALSSGQRCFLAMLCLIVLAYTQHHQTHVLDEDRWLHDAHIVAFQRGIYPPVNPLFPELAMNGHFGRDLLMATLTSEGTDPATTTWWVTPWLQLAAFLTLFASTQSLTGSATRGFSAALFVFFGMDCGFRVGLIDTFDGSNGLAYPLLVLLMHLMSKILAGARWPAWIVSGLVLGTYQLVSMTNFALLLLTGLATFCVCARTRQAWLGLLVTAILALGLAVTEGGAFTDMAHRGLQPQLNKAVQNQGLRVSVQFPKEHLFQVLTSVAGYQRTSVAYSTGLFSSLYQQPIADGYLYLWDPRFMRTHWLPLYLAPLALWLLRRSPLGLSYWLFGAISYLLPGLVNFGPIFEHEYYRWEFSAAFGLAAALGLAMGEWLERWPTSPGRLGWRPLFALLVLTASLWAGGEALWDGAKQTREDGYRAFPSVRQWRLDQAAFATGEGTLQACAWLRQRTQPGQQILTNLLNDRPIGLWPDVIAATLAGVFPAGHAYPSETEGGPHGNPAFHENSIYKAFWASGDLALLEGGKVRWLLADTAKLKPNLLPTLQALPHQVFEDRMAVELPLSSAPAAVAEWSVSAAGARVEDQDLRLGGLYQLPLTIFNKGAPSRAVLTLDKGLVEPLRFTIPTGLSQPDLYWATPFDEGHYRAVLSDPSGEEQHTFEFSVDFLKRLESLQFQTDMPRLGPLRQQHLVGTWKSPAPIHSQGALQLLVRFRLPNGDYDQTAQQTPVAIDLMLPEETSQWTLPILPPGNVGKYQMELWIQELQSRRWVQLQQTYQVTVGV